MPANSNRRKKNILPILFYYSIRALYGWRLKCMHSILFTFLFLFIWNQFSELTFALGFVQRFLFFVFFSIFSILYISRIESLILPVRRRQCQRNIDDNQDDDDDNGIDMGFERIGTIYSSVFANIVLTQQKTSIYIVDVGPHSHLPILHHTPFSWEIYGFFFGCVRAYLFLIECRNVRPDESIKK